MNKNMVQIYSIDEQTAKEKMRKVIQESNEEVFKERDYLIETDSYLYRAQRFNQNLRGNRYNYVYVDKRLSVEDKSLILMKLRPSSNLLPEELEHWYCERFVSYF